MRRFLGAAFLLVVHESCADSASHAIAECAEVDAVGPGRVLGLATAVAAIRAHHGTVGFEPRAGGGTRFWIRLPA